MRSFGGLFAQVVSLENLERAARRAMRGRRYGEAAARFILHWEQRLLGLQRGLEAGTWRPQPCALRLLYEPKPRAITLTSFENNLVHHALVDVVEPALGRSYLPETFACLAGRGAHRAVLAHQGLQRRHRFLNQLDIWKYFPSIPHDFLLEVLARRLREPRLMRLLEVILAADDGLYLEPAVVAHLGDAAYVGRRGVGVPVGTLTSQFFGNYYLCELDHYIKRVLKVPGYLRYLDNLTCFGDSRAELREWELEIGGWLARERGLRLKSRGHALRSCQARILYLGYEVTRETRRPGKRLYQRVKRRVERLRWSAVSDRQRTALARSLASYRGLVGF